MVHPVAIILCFVLGVIPAYAVAHNTNEKRELRFDSLSRVSFMLSWMFYAWGVYFLIQSILVLTEQEKSHMGKNLLFIALIIGVFLTLGSVIVFCSRRR